MDHDEHTYDPDGLAYDLEVARGMKSDYLSKRTAAERIWKAIAAGKADEGTMLSWVAFVAKEICTNIIDKDDLDDRHRGSQALISTGIYGTEDGYREMRSWIAMMLDFEECAEPGGPRNSRLTPIPIFKYFNSRGFFDNIDHDEESGIRAIEGQLALVRKDRANP